MKQENKIVTMFEAENGLWGTKDAEGNVFDEPEYERHENIDGLEYFCDNKNGLFCELTPHGFITTGTFEPDTDDEDEDFDCDDENDIPMQLPTTPITEYVYRLRQTKKCCDDYEYPGIIYMSLVEAIEGMGNLLAQMSSDNVSETSGFIIEQIPVGAEVREPTIIWTFNSIGKLVWPNSRK